MTPAALKRPDFVEKALDILEGRAHWREIRHLDPDVEYVLIVKSIFSTREAEARALLWEGLAMLREDHGSLAAATAYYRRRALFRAAATTSTGDSA